VHINEKKNKYCHVIIYIRNVTLILFNDGIYFICKIKGITKHESEYVAKHRNVKYTCRILVQHSKYMHIIALNTYHLYMCMYNITYIIISVWLYNLFNIHRSCIFEKIKNSQLNYYIFPANTMLHVTYMLVVISHSTI